MLLPDTFSGYLETAAAQVRWKRARPALAAELRTHLLDQYDAYTAEGLGEEQAAAEALRQMGDAVEVGTALDRAHRPKPQWGLLALTGVLAVVGTALRIVLTGGDVIAIDPFREVFLLAVSIGCLLGGYFLDVSFLGKHPLLCYFGLLAALFLPYPLMNDTYQFKIYAQHLVLAFPPVYAGMLYAMRKVGSRGVLLCCIAISPAWVSFYSGFSWAPILAVVASCFFLLCIAVLSGYFGGKKIFRLIVALLGTTAGLGCFVPFVWSLNRYLDRLLVSVFFPERDPYGFGYMATVIRDLLANAKWLGQGGTGERFSGLSYQRILPEVGEECLLVALIHKAGWLPFLILLLLVTVLLGYGFYRAAGQKGVLGRLVALSILMVLALQYAWGLCTTLGYPILGWPFPLISGGLPAVTNLGLMGLLLSVFRCEGLPEGVSQNKESHPSRVKWRDGELVISFRKFSASP